MLQVIQSPESWKNFSQLPGSHWDHFFMRWTLLPSFSYSIKKKNWSQLKDNLIHSVRAWKIKESSGWDGKPKDKWPNNHQLPLWRWLGLQKLLATCSADYHLPAVPRRRKCRPSGASWSSQGVQASAELCVTASLLLSVSHTHCNTKRWLSLSSVDGGRRDRGSQVSKAVVSVSYMLSVTS